MASKRICSVEGCGKVHYGLSFCESHYKLFKRTGQTRFQRYKSPHGTTYNFLTKIAIKSTGDECVETPCVSQNGYGQLRAEGKLWTASAYMCHLVNGPKPEGTECAHECGNSWCVAPKHLSWKTHQDNMDDKFRHGTVLSGERAPWSILTKNEVEQVRMLRGYLTLREIGNLFGVSKSAITMIMTGRNWRN